MAAPKFQIFISLAALLAAMTTSGSAASAAVIKGGYWFEQSVLPASSINTSFFTHIYYAFVEPNNVTYELDVSNSTATSLSTFISSLRSKDPPVKTLLSIGGGASDPLVFAQMASNASTRKIFIDSTIDVARSYGFDGLDLDWEFPQSPKEMDDLGLLFTEWRNAINADGQNRCVPPLLLSAAVYFSVEFFLSSTNRAYTVASINQNMDWINAMCYDYHGSWNNYTGALASLFDPSSNINTIYGLQSWLRAGVYPEKLLMGLPLYGRTWELKDPKVNGIGAPAIGVGPGDDGALTFSQVEKFNSETGATVVYDVGTVSVYSYSGTTWIGYDDPLTVTTKIGFAQALGLPGYFFWAVPQDSDWKISRQGIPLDRQFTSIIFSIFKNIYQYFFLIYTPLPSVYFKHTHISSTEKKKEKEKK